VFPLASGWRDGGHAQDGQPRALGFGSDPRAHDEVAEHFGREVIGLDLVDPRSYQLDTALAALAGGRSSCSDFW
jgi:hypothetical protein